MNNSDNMDIDSMVNNPFSFLTGEKPDLYDTPEMGKTAPVKPAGSIDSLHYKESSSEDIPEDKNVRTMSRNHPLELRILSMEKNLLNRDRKIDTVKQIIEHQNKRIDLLEKELDLLRRQKIENDVPNK